MCVNVCVNVMTLLEITKVVITIICIYKVVGSYISAELADSKQQLDGEHYVECVEDDKLYKTNKLYCQ